jgi:hypothetical protein
MRREEKNVPKSTFLLCDALEATSFMNLGEAAVKL